MPFDVGIVVALPVEERAVLSIMNSVQTMHYPGAVVFHKGCIGQYQVVLTKCFSQGSVYSAIATTDLIREFNPKWIALLGIAAGYPGQVNRGDVVIASQIHCYEYVKIRGKLQEHRARSFPPFEYVARITERLEGMILAVPDRPIDKKRKRRKEPSPTKICIGPLASGNKVVASALFRGRIRKIDSKMHALEMEAEGVGAVSAHAYPAKPCVVMKAISDYADRRSKGKRKAGTRTEAQHDSWQKYAASASASGFREFLKVAQDTTELSPRAIPGQPKTPLLDILSPTKPAEESFLRIVHQQPTLHLGDFDLNSKFFPEDYWNVANRKEYMFADDPEDEQQVILEWTDAPLAEGLLRELKADADLQLKRLARNQNADEAEIRRLSEFCDALARGSNPYPRLVAPPRPCRLNTHSGIKSLLLLPISDSYYAFSLIREKQIQLASADTVQSSHNVNSLAVRVALTYERDGQRWIEFHQRSPLNGTYKEAWDVGAAGYMDRSRHKDPEHPERLVSPWGACIDEITRELNIPSEDLPYRDHYSFFGVGMNWCQSKPTMQTDLLGVCQCVIAPDPTRAVRSDRVLGFDRCVLEPFALANFVEEKHYWVPTAVLALVLTLHSAGAEWSTIKAAFSRLAGKLKFDP
jgi:nucleoside phosphorylase